MRVGRRRFGGTRLQVLKERIATAGSVDIIEVSTNST